jgi:hypothetical protein
MHVRQMMARLGGGNRMFADAAERTGVQGHSFAVVIASVPSSSASWAAE